MRRQTSRKSNIDDCVVRSVREEEIPICVDFFGRGRAEWTFFFARFSFCLSLLYRWEVGGVGCDTRMDMTGNRRAR